MTFPLTMARLHPILVFTLALGLHPGSLRAENPDPAAREFLESWAESLRDMRTLRVGFVQTKSLRILRRPRVSEGEVLVAENRIRMTVRDSAGNVELELAAGPDEARLFHPRLARLEVFPATASWAARAPFPILGSDVRRIPEQYAVRIEGDQSGRVLILEPRDPEASAREIRMAFDGLSLVEVRQTDRRGDSVTLEIQSFERDIEVPPGALDLDIPTGVEVVRPFDSTRR